MIYFDSAATTLQKPPEVAARAAAAIRTMASPGRGGYRAAADAAQTVFQCRTAAAELFHLDSPEQVVFTLNATHALNIAIRSLILPGEQVLISGFEHNAVTRPLHALGVQMRVVPGGLFRPEEFLRGLRSELEREAPAAVICTHVSNVFGYVLPMDGIARLCRERGVPLIVDASQSAGILPVDAAGWGAAFVAMPGHKGLYGPQGTGLLLCPGTQRPRPLLYGGTGSNSRLQEMPDFLPDRLEAGTLNVTGIAGLEAGIRFVLETGTQRILAHERDLLAHFLCGLETVPRVRAFAAGDLKDQAGVLSLQIPGTDCEQAAETLARYGVAVRAGLHCAPLAHRSADTLEEGTVRFSFSAFNTTREADRAIEILAARM